MKIKSVIISLLAVLMLMSACTTQTPIPSPTLEPTPSPVPAIRSLYADSTQAELDYLNQVFDMNAVFRGTGINTCVGEIYDHANPNYVNPTAGQIMGAGFQNVDPSKLDDVLISKKISTPESDSNVYGGLFYDKTTLSGCTKMDYKLLLYFDCKKDNAIPKYITVNSIKDGTMEIIAVYDFWNSRYPENVLVSLEFMLPYREGLVVSDAHREMRRELEAVTNVVVTYKTVQPLPPPPEYTPYPGSPVADFNADELDVMKQLLQKHNDERFEIPVNDGSAQIKAIKASSYTTEMSIQNKIAALNAIKVSHDSYIGGSYNSFHPVYGPIVFDESAIYGSGDSLFLVAFIDATSINFYINGCAGVTLDNGCLNVEIDMKYTMGADAAIKPTLIVVEIEGCNANDITMADLRFVPDEIWW